MTENQQFCLRWNNHHSTLTTVFSSLQVSDTFADCVLIAKGKAAKVHKVVLSACSPYLKGLLVDHTNVHPTIILDNFESYELEALVEFMYCGEVNIQQEHLEGFLKAADSLQIKGLSGMDKKDEPSLLESLKTELTNEESEPDERDTSCEFPNYNNSNLSDSLNENISQSYSEPSSQPISVEKFDYENEVSNHVPHQMPIINPSLLPGTVGASFYPPNIMSQHLNAINQLAAVQSHEQSLYSHMQDVRPRKWGSAGECEQEFKCDACSKRYRSKTSLNLHKRWECGREPQFQCPFCLKKTHQKGNLKVHIMSKHRDHLNLAAKTPAEAVTSIISR